MSIGSPVREQKVEKPAYVDMGASLPDKYNEDCLVILPRDPHWIFAYWEVTDGKKNELKKIYGESIFDVSRTVLRVHDVTGVKKFTGCESNGFKDIAILIGVGNWYINVDNPGRAYCVELGLVTQDGKFIMILRSNIINLPLGKVSDVTDEQWALMTEDYEKLLAVSGVDKIGVGSLEMAKFLAKRWEFLNAVSSAAFSGVTSRGFKVSPSKERKFWLVADCELIVYGATEPGASLTINNKQVNLSPFGTFSIRVDFPDGKKEFDIKATSEDKVDERRIVITAERGTRN